MKGIVSMKKKLPGYNSYYYPVIFKSVPGQLKAKRQ